MRYLIVNADDFGYSYAVNRGIIEGHTKGVVTSTSVMVDGFAAEEAAELSEFPDLAVGLHFAVTDFSKLQSELERQVAKFVAIVGHRPDHIDTHKIYTSHAGFKDVLPAYAKKHGIPLRQRSGAAFIDSFFGMHSDGDVSVSRLKQAVDQATEYLNELMCHVGHSDEYLRQHSSYSDMREQELRSICDPSIKQYIRDKGLQLSNWKQLSAYRNFSERSFREQAQKDGITHISTGVAVVRDGKILMARRAANDFLGGVYELPGGGVDEGETIAEGAIREVKEETGLTASRVVTVFDGFDYSTDRKPKVRQVNFIVQVEAGEVALDASEHDGFVWVNEDNFDDIKMSDSMRICVRDALKLMCSIR